MTEDTLSDARRVYHFWMDDEVLDTYGSHLGPYGIAVYAYLARRSKLTKAFPSHARIAKDIGTSRDTVIRALKRLQSANLVTIEARVSESGDPDTNLYILNDLSQLHTPCSSSQLQGSSSQQGGVVAHSREGSSCELHEVFSLKDPQLKEEDNSLTTFESLDGAGRSVCPAPSSLTSQPPTVSRRKPSKPVPISEASWPGLRQALQDFNLPLEHLDDNAWWNSLNTTCNDPDLAWLERQFARMEAWLTENPRKRPTTRWKTFVRGWLERAYEHERKTYAARKR